MPTPKSGFTDPGTPTPTPWRLIVLNWGYQIIHGNRVIAAISGHASDKRKDPQAYADALLLVAAPELLDAAQRLLDYAGESEHGECEAAGDPGGPCAWCNLRAAVEKARGE
jgi:hypothetical protein